MYISVPFRDSVLTKLLKNALGGNSKTIMVSLEFSTYTFNYFAAIIPVCENQKVLLGNEKYIQWWIQDLPDGGSNPKGGAPILPILAENFMKTKKFGPGGG